MNFVEKKNIHDRLLGVTHMDADRELLRKHSPGHKLIGKRTFNPLSDASSLLWALLDFASENEILNNRRSIVASGAKAEGESVPAKVEEEPALAEVDEKVSSTKAEGESVPAKVEEEPALAEVDEKVSSTKAEGEPVPAKVEEEPAPAEAEEEASATKAEEIISNANDEAEQIIDDAEAEAEEIRSAAKRDVSDKKKSQKKPNTRQ